MSAYALRLSRLLLAPAARRRLPPAPRVVYVLAGALDIATPAPPVARVIAGTAWHSSSACEACAGAAGATCLAWELTHDGAPRARGRCRARARDRSRSGARVADARRSRRVRAGRRRVAARSRGRRMETAFVRVSILPREIRGQSSIVYVDPADAARGKPRRDTVDVDEPIALRV
jgi:hypothetical protein